MNNELIKLYASKWDELCKELEPLFKEREMEYKPANPFLISVPDEKEYREADIRIMIYGKETNSWNGVFDGNIDSSIKTYKDFYGGGEWKEYGGNFFPSVKKFIRLLQEKYPDKKINMIWNNLVKIGSDGHTGFIEDYHETEIKTFSVIKDELKILKPTVALFLTGPYYDYVIRENFGDINFSKLPIHFSEKQIAKLTIPGVAFAFRTYHPGYLLRNDLDSYFNAIIDKINIYEADNIYLKTKDQLQEELKEIKSQKSDIVSEQKYEQAARLRDREKLLEEALEYKF
jgi:hypothetical protein